MSGSLVIECDWLDQPLAADLLERRTWASFRIHASGRAVTRLWDRESLAERTSLYIPLFPIARWVVSNWWALFYEPSRSENVPTAAEFLSSDQRSWLQRHCLRAAESG